MNARLDPVNGLYPVVSEFSDWCRLLKLSDAWAPVGKPCCTPALACMELATRVLASYVWKLICGVVWCDQFHRPVTAGSKTGTADPLDCATGPWTE